MCPLVVCTCKCIWLWRSGVKTTGNCKLSKVAAGTPLWVLFKRSTYLNYWTISPVPFESFIKPPLHRCDWNMDHINFTDVIEVCAKLALGAKGVISSYLWRCEDISITLTFLCTTFLFRAWVKTSLIRRVTWPSLRDQGIYSDHLQDRKEGQD